MRFHKNLAMLLVFVAALAWSAASLGQTPGQRKATDKNGTTAFLKAIEISEKISPIEVVKVTAEDGNTMDVVFRKPPGKGRFPRSFCYTVACRKFPLSGASGKARRGGWPRAC